MTTNRMILTVLGTMSWVWAAAPAVAVNQVYNGDFEGPCMVDGDGDLVPEGWTKGGGSTSWPVPTIDCTGDNGPSLPGIKAMHWQRASGSQSGRQIYVRQDLSEPIDASQYDVLELSLDVKVIDHNLQAGGWVTPASEWPVRVDVHYTLASDPAQTQVWRHGFYLADPGDVGGSGDSPIDDPGSGIIPVYEDTVVPQGVWTTQTFDLFAELPDLGVITRVAVGGAGWAFEGLADNVVIDLDPVDPCASDFSVTAPVAQSSNTCGAGDDCGLEATEEHIYEVTIPEAGDWTFSLCGSAYDTVLYLGTTCCGDEIASNDDWCGSESEITVALDSGTYYLTVEGLDDCGDYELDIFKASACPDGVCDPDEDCITCPQDCSTACPCTDFSVTAPAENSSSTCGAGDDCDRKPSEDHTYEVTIPEAGQWKFSLCGSDYNTYLYLGATCCRDGIAWQDDSWCGLDSEFIVALEPGTYYLTVEGHDLADCGDYVLDISRMVLCSNGFVDAGEECDDGYADACGSCNEDCTGAGTGSTCGDGEVCPETEECDDEYTDACGSCNADCTAPGTGSCGDGELCPETEECDDGYADACGSCNADCTGPGEGSTCGDGQLCLETEVCDDGYTGVCGFCNADCTDFGTGSCGDGELCLETEECDDGNTVDDDCCSSICEVEQGVGCLFNSPGQPADPKHRARKHRYLSIDPSTNPQVPTVLKVEIAEMLRCQNDPRRSCLVNTDCPWVCSNDENIICIAGAGACGVGVCFSSGPCVDVTPDPPVGWLVQEPRQNTYGCLAPGCNPATQNCCGDEDWVGHLSDTPYVDPTNWQVHDLIHISDCGVSPSITYAVYACDPVNVDICSPPLYVGTQENPSGTPRHFGDIASPPQPGTISYGPPDGFVNVADISAWVRTKQNYGTLEQPQLHPTMADIHGPGTGIPAQYILNIGDLEAILTHAFTRFLPWDNPFGLGGVDPSVCPNQLP